MGSASNSSKTGISSFAGLSRAQLIFALTGMMLTLLTSAMDQAISTSAMPRAIASLNGFARYSWPATSFSLTSAIAIPVFAKLSDLYGRKWLYLFCAAFFVVALLLCGAAGTLPIPLDGMNQLVVARGFAGLANGGVIAISYTLIADLFPPSERGRYQGLLGAFGASPCSWDQALAVGSRTTLPGAGHSLPIYHSACLPLQLSTSVCRSFGSALFAMGSIGLESPH